MHSCKSTSIKPHQGTRVQLKHIFALLLQVLNICYMTWVTSHHHSESKRLQAKLLAGLTL